MSNKEPGYVYILANPSFRKDWVKIGKETIYNNLNDDNKGFCHMFNDSIYHSSAVNAEMDDWLESHNSKGK